MSIQITLEGIRLKCPECDHIYEGEEPDEVRARLEPAYECANDGTMFVKEDTEGGDNRCPDCNKFAAKMDPDERVACQECNMASDLQEIYVITCACHDEEHEVYI